MPSSQSNQSVLDALKIGRAYQNLPAVNKCDAIPPQALHRMKVDDMVNYTIKCNTLGEQKEVHTEPW